MLNTASATFPYQRDQQYCWLSEIQTVPKKICDYLMDFPQAGYTPPTSNEYPRVRLAKYLYYDIDNPLAQPAVSVPQKLSMIYNPQKPDVPPTEKGYRVFPLSYVGQAQSSAQTIIRVYIGRIIPSDSYHSQIGICFDILSNMSYENNLSSTALSRCIGIEQCLWECLNGVNFAGIGTIYCDRRQHGDCGSYSITDENSNVGRRLVMALTTADSEPPPHTSEC